mmetsp:Transcript_38419/g.89311  ORF Transcript_38419/g.89311 Transcript_38419/m.89311 type:complete len:231 (-) Transcript_38419:118-810(-)|eukprot:CAMPEP_0113302452 /NCGR_PEP_ID=MMETSP0010_2-20120614/3257_1 /TAXON_ID=216773 ORGANISM="Corethron hystrix, Strain 308" /NCGR_SAMPLE_ID=MMETSP0010_2 /ASSEMBLY_ACC=CAM_ASM_000155 /LENGTH=230 /DNA_ID=CAMNT_0000156241 /DNA_START=66 /DNA_END=758 /DNA_ORIENTATION=- /assembly_acc=CAM_ASM_000155
MRRVLNRFLNRGTGGVGGAFAPPSSTEPNLGTKTQNADLQLSVMKRRRPEVRLQNNSVSAGGSSSCRSIPVAITSSLQRYRRESGNENFFPCLILAQIVALQCFHYVGLGVAVQFDHFVYGTTSTLDRIFTTWYLNLHAAGGWVDNTAILVSWGLYGAILLVLIIEKSKKCLDFGVTCFIIHVVVCTFYQEFPKTADWWIVNILGMIIMIIFGEYLCSRVELRDIPLLPL